jgi:hypothetical protein
VLASSRTKLAGKDVRRLKLAAKRGITLTVLFRPGTAAQRQSMAELRILLHPAPAPDGLCFEILKRRHNVGSRARIVRFCV